MLCSNFSFLYSKPVLYMISTSAGQCLLVLLPVCPLWMCIVAYLLMCWWHLHLCSSKWFPGPCSLHDCSRTVSPKGILGHVCIWCATCIGILSAQCTAATEKAWPHPYWVFPIMAYGQWWCILPPWSSIGGTSLVHVVSQGYLILCCCRTTQCSIGFCWKRQ